MGEHYNQAAVEKALIDEYKEMGMDNDEWMPDKETRMKGFNYFARGMQTEIWMLILRISI